MPVVEAAQLRVVCASPSGWCSYRPGDLSRDTSTGQVPAGRGRAHRRPRLRRAQSATLTTGTAAGPGQSPLSDTQGAGSGGHEDKWGVGGGLTHLCSTPRSPPRFSGKRPEKQSPGLRQGGSSFLQRVQRACPVPAARPAEQPVGSVGGLGLRSCVPYPTAVLTKLRL